MLKNRCEPNRKSESSIKEEAIQTIVFTSKKEDRARFNKAMIGIVRKTGQAYGVNQSLIEEGIFSITATPLGRNLCLMEENVKGDLEALLQDVGDWKDTWFKEVRRWRKTDVECSRATWLSIYGIPCYVRNTRFLETLLSDVGSLAITDKLEDKPDRLNVIKVLVFQTNLVQSVERSMLVWMVTSSSYW